MGKRRCHCDDVGVKINNVDHNWFLCSKLNDLISHEATRLKIKKHSVLTL